MANEYWLLSDLSLSGGDNPLTWNPYPAEFYPFSETKVDGTGSGIGLGLFQFKWTNGDGILTPTQWDYLMGLFTGWEPPADVYVRTRTDLIVTDSYAEHGRKYDYQWFSAKMWRPQGEPYPGFRYRNVEIIFTHGELV